jgi:hypothetical protein
MYKSVCEEPSQYTTLNHYMLKTAFVFTFRVYLRRMNKTRNGWRNKEKPRTVKQSNFDFPP